MGRTDGEPLTLSTSWGEPTSPQPDSELVPCSQVSNPGSSTPGKVTMGELSPMEYLVEEITKAVQKQIKDEMYQNRNTWMHGQVPVRDQSLKGNQPVHRRLTNQRLIDHLVRAAAAFSR